MRKYLIEAIFIFVSVLGSFTIDGYRKDSIEKEELNESVITLGEEIESNLKYAEEYLNQISNFQYLNNFVVDNYYSKKLTYEKLIQIHDKNPHIYGYDTDGLVSYITKYDDHILKGLIANWNAWEPNTIFFKSMLSSGKLLEIKNKKIRTEIETIYSKHQERIHYITMLYVKEQSFKIYEWFEKKSINTKGKSNEFLFNNERDDELYQYVKNIGLDNEFRIQGVENYIKSINNVIKLISSEYKKIE
tara:strand:+ start:79 stop:816 length:738 start_codon:yes stop_codon:yes gene_type:complete